MKGLLIRLGQEILTQPLSYLWSFKIIKLSGVFYPLGRLLSTVWQN